MAKKRIDWIDMAKGLAMLLIILSHTNKPEIYERIYTPIFLTVLFFLSGYTFNIRNSFKEFFINKVKTLVIPLFMLGGINAILAFIVEGDNIVYRFKGLLLERNSGNDDMWFVACLFSCEILLYVIIKVCQKNKKLILLSISITSIIGMVWFELVKIRLIWQFETSLIMVLYLGLGYLYHSLEKKYEKYVSTKNIIISTILYFIIIISYNNYANLHKEILGNEIIFIIASFVGITSLIMLCKKLKPCKYIIFIGRNTLVYYAFQSKAIKVIYIILNKISININQYILSIIIMIIVSLILIIPSIIINKYFPFLIGKKYDKVTIKNKI